MALQMSRNSQTTNKPTDGDKHNYTSDFDEEINEIEKDLIANYEYLTKHCGLSQGSPAIRTAQTHRQEDSFEKPFVRQYSIRKMTKTFNESPVEKRRSTLNYISKSKQDYMKPINNMEQTIYYPDIENNNQDNQRSFSLVKLFARMKARLKHNKRYSPKQTHELLREEESQEWYELTKNVRKVLTFALLRNEVPCAPELRIQTVDKRDISHRGSTDCQSALTKDTCLEDKIDFNADDDISGRNEKEIDDIIRDKFTNCSRGINYRRCGICKAIDRQQYQGQLVYFYGVANNIIIDENLKASGLG